MFLQPEAADKLLRVQDIRGEPCLTGLNLISLFHVSPFHLLIAIDRYLPSQLGPGDPGPAGIRIITCVFVSEHPLLSLPLGYTARKGCGNILGFLLFLYAILNKTE